MKELILIILAAIVFTFLGVSELVIYYYPPSPIELDTVLEKLSPNDLSQFT